MRVLNVGWGGPQLAITVGLGLAVACSSFSGDNGASPGQPPPDQQPDASTNPPVGGTPKGEVTLEVASSVMLVHNETLTLDVNITRVPPFAAGMTLTVRGLPAGIAADSVDVVPTASAAQMKLVVAKSAVQGALANVVLEAHNGTALVGQVSLAGFVRGSSGELDTTFGKAGVVALDNDANQLAMTEDGGFYVLESVGSLAVRKYTKDGVLDTTFGGGTGLYLSGPATPMSAIAWKKPYLFVAGGVQGASPLWYVRRLDATGKLDATYGVGGTYSIAAPAQNTVRTLAIGPAGEAVIGGVLPATGGGAVWATSAGTVALASPDNDSGFSKVLFGFNQLLHEGTRIVGAASPNVLAITSSMHKFDSAFTYTGFGASVVLTSIARDGAGKYVLGGLENGTDLVLARVMANGVADPTFASNGVFHTAIPTNGGGGFLTVVTGDKIVQVGTVLDGAVYRCVIARYTSTGASDTTFGQVGKSVPLIDECYAGQVAAQADGRLVISGHKLIRLWP